MNVKRILLIAGMTALGTHPVWAQSHATTPNGTIVDATGVYPLVNGQPVSSSNPLPVTGGGGGGGGGTTTSIYGQNGTSTMLTSNPFADNIVQVGGVTISLGQTTMSASLPVTFASNQSALPVTGTFFQATQPVSGTFFQATQPVSGTFFQATQPVSGTVGVSALPALPAGTNAIGTVTATQGTSPWVTSLTSLPALAAGSNAIGTVGVTSLPALSAGTNSIGTVVLGAGSSPVGTVTLGAGAAAVGSIIDTTAAATVGAATGGTQPSNAQLTSGTFNTTVPTVTSGSSYPIQEDSHADVRTGDYYNASVIVTTSGSTSSAYSYQVGAGYSASLPTRGSGQSGELQADAEGRLLVNGSSNGTPTAIAASLPALGSTPTLIAAAAAIKEGFTIENVSGATLFFSTTATAGTTLTYLNAMVLANGSSFSSPPGYPLGGALQVQSTTSTACPESATVGCVQGVYK